MSPPGRPKGEYRSAEREGPPASRPSARRLRAPRAGDERPDDRAAVLSATLAVLDGLLAVAVDKTARLLGPATLLDPWRGMHLDLEDVRRALRGEHVARLDPGDAVPAPGADAAAALSAPLLASPAVATLFDAAALDAMEVAIVAIALAPDIDLRYGRIYGYLQDDIAARRPAPDLIANLLGGSPAGRLRVLDRLAASAPLMRGGVLHAVGAGDAAALGRGMQLGALWLSVLTRGNGLLAGVPAAAAAFADVTADVAALASRIAADARQHAAPVRLVLQGPDGAGKYELAQQLARAAGLSLSVVDLRACGHARELRAAIDAEMLAARLQSALPYLHGVAGLGLHDAQLPRLLQDLLADPTCAFVLALNAPLPCVGSQAVSADRIDLPRPDAGQRERCWAAALAERGIEVATDELASVAERFALSRAQIRQAVADLDRMLRVHDARLTRAVKGTAATAQSGAAAVARVLVAATSADLAGTARNLCGDELARLAQRIRPAAGFDNLVAAPEVFAQLREMCSRVALRDRVRRWCGESVHRRARGVNALFAGPSGTGKTLAAEIVAYVLELDLFRIDLAAVVSKYIGETEKNLDRVFAAAENANAVLFFDEAEALFGKRSEVKDAHDRYANIEIAYLLQKIEGFDGVAILATNLKQNLDDAFTRRLTFCINFAFPEEAERLRLWNTLWPAAAKRAPDVDFAILARDYKLSGGNIRNVVTASLYLAAGSGDGMVTRDHLLHATRREYQKFGKTLAAVTAAVGERPAHPVDAAMRVRHG